MDGGPLADPMTGTRGVEQGGADSADEPRDSLQVI